MGVAKASGSQRWRVEEFWRVALTLFVVAFATAASDTESEDSESDPAAGTGIPAAVAEVSQLPSTLSVAAGDEATITVAVTNPTATPVAITDWRVEAPSTVGWQAGDFSVATIPAGDRATLDLIIAAGSTAGTAALTTIVTLTEQMSAGGEMVERSVEAVTEVTVVVPSPTLDVAIASAPASVADGQDDTKVSVVVRNTGAYALRDVSFEYLNSSDLSLRLAGPDGCAQSSPAGEMSGDPIAPGTATTVVLCLDVDDVVRAGKQTVGVVVSGSFETPGNSIAGSSTATTTIEVTVLGITALGPLGAAAVFLFPALVPIIVFLGLSRVVYPRTAWLPSKLEVTELGSTVWLVPAAALAYAVYWLVTGVDLTRQTSTQAIIVLYVAAMAFGVFAWVLFSIGYNRHTGRKRFRPGDTPLKVLERLHAGGRPLSMPIVRDSTPPKYILGSGPQGEVAVCSKIEYEFTGTNEERAEFNAAIDTDDAGKVVEKRGTATFEWTGSGVLLVQTVERGTDNRVIGSKQG